MTKTRVINQWMDRDPNWVFVPVEHGKYMRVEVAVVRAPCIACGAQLGVPCKRLKTNGMDYSSFVHDVRKTHAKAGHLHDIYHDVISEEVESPLK
jgi:hypothetical protein